MGAIPATRRPKRTNSDEPRRDMETGCFRATGGPPGPCTMQRRLRDASRGLVRCGQSDHECGKVQAVCRREYHRRGPWPSLQEVDVEAGGGRGTGLKVTVFAQFTETQILPDFPPGLGKRDPSAEPYSSVSRRRGGDGSGDAPWRNPGRCTPMREGFGGGGRRVWYPDRRTIFDTATPSPPSGDGAWRSLPASGYAAPHMNVPATGIIHAGPGSLMRRGGEATNRNASSRIAARIGIASVGAASCRPTPKTGGRRGGHR